MEQQFVGNLKWTSDDEIEIRIKDITKKIVYKGKTRASDKKGLALILTTFEKYGINIREIAEIIEQRKRFKREIKQEDWFGYPLGNKK